MFMSGTICCSSIALTKEKPCSYKLYAYTADFVRLLARSCTLPGQIAICLENKIDLEYPLKEGQEEYRGDVEAFSGAQAFVGFGNLVFYGFDGYSQFFGDFCV